jgi:hypothetical protein
LCPRRHRSSKNFCAFIAKPRIAIARIDLPESRASHLSDACAAIIQGRHGPISAVTVLPLKVDPPHYERYGRSMQLRDSKAFFGSTWQKNNYI